MFETLARWRRDAGTGGWSPENLRKAGLGLAPRTVIDVGVGAGTPHLYRAFPDAYHVLVEPLREWEPALQRVLENYRGEYVLAAAGAAPGAVTITVDTSALQISSIKKRWHRGELLEDREVEVVTLDALLEERGWHGPFGLKVDTEGFEVEVIEGATKLLEETEFVIAEVSVAPIFEGGYTFAEFVALMDSRGFRLCDVLDGEKNPRGLINIDLQFVRNPGRRSPPPRSRRSKLQAGGES
jgi:FkbM family methyltransferase